MRKLVVFPAPLGPSSPDNLAPVDFEKSTPSTTRRRPYDLHQSLDFQHGE